MNTNNEPDVTMFEDGSMLIHTQNQANVLETSKNYDQQVVRNIMTLEDHQWSKQQPC